MKSGGDTPLGKMQASESTLNNGTLHTEINLEDDHIKPANMDQESDHLLTYNMCLKGI